MDDEGDDPMDEYPTSYHQMIHDHAGPSFDWNRKEESNPEVRNLFEMIGVRINRFGRVG
ncbi:hypothetical protein Scep_012801 [Stephania cephalantha]|uniref:Uncharacterized protein n=1 Tax=Stephania cephalantha TaxID=152367 RepID=A0AAP0JFS4_9MAGN